MPVSVVWADIENIPKIKNNVNPLVRVKSPFLPFRQVGSRVRGNAAFMPCFLLFYKQICPLV